MNAPVEMSLAWFQARMTAALLAADPQAKRLDPELFCGVHAGAVGLRVHRNTALSAISNALRLSFVAVERLVGEEFFDRMAVAYARAAPPSVPQLDEYGAGFAEYIDGFPGTEGLPYLSELARLDWQLSALGRLRCDGKAGVRLLLEGGVQLHFAAPLRTLVSRYAVDQLRAAILAEDLDTLRAIALAPTEHHHVLWRTEEGVSVRSVSAPSARFIDAALAGASAASALLAAAAGDERTTEVAAILAREILPAGFVRVHAGELPAA